MLLYVLPDRGFSPIVLGYHRINPRYIITTMGNRKETSVILTPRMISSHRAPPCERFQTLDLAIKLLEFLEME
jgi:hypothetical protein